MIHPVSRLLAAASAAAALLCALPARAADLNSVQLLNQAQFRLLSEDLGSVAAYKALIPSEPTGLIGFDIGVAGVLSQLRHQGVFQTASSNDDPGRTLYQNQLRVNKGLPFELDIGASLAKTTDSNLQVAGFDLRWAPVPGGAVIPAVGVRLAITKVTGVDQLDVSTVSADLSVSKGFLFITPYAGIGVVQVNSTPNGIATLKEEKFNLTRVFAGTNIALGLMNIIIEADKTGEAANLGVKVGVRF